MDIKLMITNASKPMSDADYSRILDLSFNNGGNGIEFPLKDDSYAIPWDADFSIEGSDVIIEGGVGPSGFGHAVARIPKNRVHGIFDSIFIYVRDDASDAIDEIEEILSTYNWI